MMFHRKEEFAVNLEKYTDEIKRLVPDAETAAKKSQKDAWVELLDMFPGYKPQQAKKPNQYDELVKYLKTKKLGQAEENELYETTKKMNERQAANAAQR